METVGRRYRRCSVSLGDSGTPQRAGRLDNNADGAGGRCVRRQAVARSIMACCRGGSARDEGQSAPNSCTRSGHVPILTLTARRTAQISPRQRRGRVRS